MRQDHSRARELGSVLDPCQRDRSQKIALFVCPESQGINGDRSQKLHNRKTKMGTCHAIRCTKVSRMDKLDSTNDL